MLRSADRKHGPKETIFTPPSTVTTHRVRLFRFFLNVRIEACSEILADRADVDTVSNAHRFHQLSLAATEVAAPVRATQIVTQVSRVIHSQAATNSRPALVWRSAPRGLLYRASKVPR